ncbi:dihydrofolate reductase [Klenkia taihuensis]|uniref:dihydrofolate reductase n=1 Tax=Klenkia taihuensis TaxID=1225127 RepID=A0A1I1V5L9_9ACTN|nr:dihydrofolate reductase [Klenkia taihuensis]GHE14526.1 dihydrofolate reductase [Klenkia taihuensis]SFD78115.1 dihydrofolate reductase [Klenkia taihuensis]
MTGPVTLSLVVAVADDGVIGDRNGLPWHISEDLRRFRELTTGHVVVAGRLTHESVTSRLGRPLPGRHTVVVSGSTPPGGPQVWTPDAATVVPDLDTALELAGRLAVDAPHPDVVVMGGAQLYRQALPQVGTVHLTRVHLTPGGDTRMPEGWLDGFTVVDSRDLTTGSGTEVTFETLTRG